MKKRMLSVFSLVLALVMLAGCAVPQPLEELFGGGDEASAHEKTIPFGEMVYTRPEPEQMDKLMQELQELLDGNAFYKKVTAKLDECFDWYYSFYTMYTLAEIHSYLDMTDDYYADEFEWISEEYALVQKAYDKLYYACAGSKLADKLEKGYFWEGFKEEYSNPEDSIYSDEYVALLQEESDLLARYHELVAAPVILFNGKEEDFFTLLENIDGADYNRALQIYYETYNPQLAEIYIKLVGVRKAMAAQLEYESYEQMQYEYYFERDYSPADADGYLEQIRKSAVPFYKRLMSVNAYGHITYDLVSEETLFTTLQAAAGEVGGDVAEAFAFMEKYELCDIGPSPKKAQMSFETYIPDYEAPFVFLGAAGDTSDVLSFAHEFGHFCDGYVNDGAMEESIDLAEVYSQAMELLILSRLSNTMSEEDVQNIARMKAIDTVSMYIQQAAFAEFEKEVYALGEDELTAEKLNEIMLRQTKAYGFYSAGYDWYYGMSWIDITHFFESPFYVVSYPISNDLAMQIYALEREEAGKGMEKYLGVLRHDFNGVMGLVDEGFASPFSEGRVDSAVQLLSELYGF